MLLEVLSEIMLCKTFVKMRQNLRSWSEAGKCANAGLVVVAGPDGKGALKIKKEGNLTIFSFLTVTESLCLSVQQNFAIVE